MMWNFFSLSLIKVIIFNHLTELNQASHVTALSLRLLAQILLTQAVWVIHTNTEIHATYPGVLCQFWTPTCSWQLTRTKHFEVLLSLGLLHCRNLCSFPGSLFTFSFYVQFNQTLPGLQCWSPSKYCIVLKSFPISNRVVNAAVILYTF